MCNTTGKSKLGTHYVSIVVQKEPNFHKVKWSVTLWVIGRMGETLFHYMTSIGQPIIRMQHIDESGHFVYCFYTVAEFS